MHGTGRESSPGQHVTVRTERVGSGHRASKDTSRPVYLLGRPGLLDVDVSLQQFGRSQNSN